MESRELRRFLGGELRKHGFEYQSPSWRRRESELTWVVELEHSPFAPRYDIDIGVIPNGDADATPRIGDCPMSVSYAQLVGVPSLRPVNAGTDRRFTDHLSYFSMLMDFAEGDVSDVERREALTALAERLSSLAMEMPTLVLLRQRYATGMFDAAAIRWDFRQTLES